MHLLYYNIRYLMIDWGWLISCTVCSRWITMRNVPCMFHVRQLDGEVALTVRMKFAALFTDTASAVELHLCIALANVVSIAPLLPSIRHSIAPRSRRKTCTCGHCVHGTGECVLVLGPLVATGNSMHNCTQWAYICDICSKRWRCSYWKTLYVVLRCTKNTENVTI